MALVHIWSDYLTSGALVSVSDIDFRELSPVESESVLVSLYRILYLSVPCVCLGVY